MSPVLQQLRTSSATKLPASLEAGQIAFNLANHWILIGDGSSDVTVDGTALAYGTTATVLGIANVAVPAKPAAGKGYYISKLAGKVAATLAGMADFDPTLLIGGVATTTQGAVTGGVSGTYSGITPSATSGMGAGATFIATVTGPTAATVAVENPGHGYAVGDTITLPAGALGTGSGALTLTVGTVASRMAPLPAGAGLVARDPAVAAGQPGAY